jgi:hypothetical protein
MARFPLPALHLHLRHLFLPLVLALLTACVTVQVPQVSSNENLPPVLTSDELFRPYQNVGTIQVSREWAGDPTDLLAEIQDWSHDALGIEAAKLGADAITNVEIQSEKSTYLLIFPWTITRAKGTAIKFR